ncbi:GDSL esterase/lipase At4g10955-like [Carya illinoinensis]|uniref:Fungal lipase-type domain-containing protein n=1 Tax=Carya illinoinensis TaxID=32201 RepID=A0A8T1QM83_CARIL|nr:GDSL esterase/lipase At4g10955-like [Carya illinoinensis]KAG6655938.1 hypothetical protein CIPAW_05G251100 [Carya illinoinensis]
MGNEKRNFDISGPKHLKDIVDWNNADYRRSAISSLVQGVYVLESERENSTNAQPWYESFKFQLVEPIKRDDQSIFGAIYKYIGKYPAPDSDVLPRYVIALRGTVDLKRPKIWGIDIMMDIKLLLNKLEESSCFILATDRVKRLVKENGAPNVWLAGHSLGAAVALLVGKKIIFDMECYPEAYLFNPPFLSIPTNHFLGDGKVKKIIQTGRRSVKAALTVAAKPRNSQMKEHFHLLSCWTPHMFVNPGDVVCREYIDYFQRNIRDGKIMRLAESNSFGNLFNHVVRWKDLKNATHLLPSAELIVNHSCPGPNIDDNIFSPYYHAHDIRQWWDREVRCQSTIYNIARNDPQPTTEDP